MTQLYYLVAAIVASVTVTQIARGCTDQPGCYCFDGYVTCFGLTDFPTSFPPNTTTLRISNMTVKELPADVFQKLPVLVSVEITDSNIGRIVAGAFHDMSELDFINFHEVDIETIESFAFKNLIDIGTISFYMANIGTIQEYAFTNIFALDDLTMFSLNITTIQTNAFYDIDEILSFSFYTNNVGQMNAHAVAEIKHLDTLDMYLNTFGMLGCGVVETLISNSREMSFYSNSAPCDCRLSWVLDSTRLAGNLFSNWCRVPGIEEKVYFSDLKRETLLCHIDPDTACPVFVKTTNEPYPTKQTTAATDDTKEMLKYELKQVKEITKPSTEPTTPHTVVSSSTPKPVSAADIQNDYPDMLNTPTDEQVAYVHVKPTENTKGRPTAYRPASTNGDESLVDAGPAKAASGKDKADDRRHAPARSHKKRGKLAPTTKSKTIKTPSSVASVISSGVTVHTNDRDTSTVRIPEPVSESLGAGLFDYNSNSGAWLPSSCVTFMISVVLAALFLF